MSDGNFAFLVECSAVESLPRFNLSPYPRAQAISTLEKYAAAWIEQPTVWKFCWERVIENGGEKLGHGSGGMTLLRAA